MNVEHGFRFRVYREDLASLQDFVDAHKVACLAAQARQVESSIVPTGAVNLVQIAIIPKTKPLTRTAKQYHSCYIPTREPSH